MLRAPRPARRLAFLTAALATTAALTSAFAGCSGSDAPPPPNIVVLQVDDETLAQMTPSHMPKTEAFFAHGGTRFSDYTVSTPQCCPSRTALITGAYGHNSGVTSNHALGGFVDPQNIMPANLQDAGYVTAHIGKYLVNYRDDPSVPAGWTEWYTRLGAERSPYYDYDMAVNGHVVHYGHRRDDYSTRVYTRYALHLVSKYVGGSKPLYMQVDYSAPHSAPDQPPCGYAPDPDPRDIHDYRGVPAPRPRSYDERNVSDKPRFVRELPHLDAHAAHHIQNRWDCTLASLEGVDRSIGEITDAIRKAGALDDTVFVYTSDNGYFFGEHRLETGKVLPYEEAIHLPLFMRVPDRYLVRPEPAVVSAPVQNIDLAPTFVALAGACGSGTRCRVMDGRSLLGLLGGDTAGFDNRPVLIEYDQSPSSKHGVCAYSAVRTPTQIYAHYTKLLDPRTGKCSPSNVVEHYDLRRDPYELHNLYPARPGSPAAAEERRLRATLSRLQDCEGVSGRDPEPASGHYCS